MEDIEPFVEEILRRIERWPNYDELREGLRDTPRRVQKAYKEMFAGYWIDIDELFTTFDGEGKDQIVALKDISFNSVCEHHMMPFSGIAHVAYLPTDKVIGASKMARLIEAYSRRLQIQERIGEQVANTLMEKLNPLGVAVIIEAKHGCMVNRGVKNHSSKLVTSVMLGKFRHNLALKFEVLTLLGLIK